MIIWNKHFLKLNFLNTTPAYIRGTSSLCLQFQSSNLLLTPAHLTLQHLKNGFSFFLFYPLCLQCERKEEYIECIQTLDFDTKAAIASHIQEVFPFHSKQNWKEGRYLTSDTSFGIQNLNTALNSNLFSLHLGTDFVILWFCDFRWLTIRRTW